MVCGDQDRNLPSHQLGRQLGHLIVAALRVAVFDGDILADDEAAFFECLEKRFSQWGLCWRRPTAKVADDWRLSLRAPSQRPQGRASENANQFPPSHAGSSL